MSGKKNMHFGTKSVWDAEEKPFWQGATQLPIVQSVTFGYSDIKDWYNVGKGEKKGHIYSRNTNPTVEVFEEKLKKLEEAQAATSFATGMAAISNTLFTFLKPHDRVVTINHTYGGTNKIFLHHLPTNLVDVKICETDDHKSIEQEVMKGCKVLYLETPTNPTLKIVDIKRLSHIAHDVGAIVIVDNTFATPINQNPLNLGADLVIHSATKFLGGHSDAMGGILCGRKDLVDEVFCYREITGATLDSMSAYLLLRGIKTLELRVLRQNENAMAIANHLTKHKKVSDVYYPGLKNHPYHEIASEQMRGFGGVLSFSLHGGFEKVVTLLENLKHVHLAASLGSVSTLAGPPRTTSHVELTEEERKSLGIDESLIRFSVGIENASDLIADLDNALSKV